MVDNLLEIYEKELNNKICLKVTPNKTEEQILYQSFKFFDLEGTGYCNLRDFIKANERIGVILNHLKDFETIFNYFDSNNTGVIDYKRFSKAILVPQGKERKSQSPFNLNLNPNSNPNPNPNSHKSSLTQPLKKQGVFFDKLVNSLLQNGGAKALISLCKEFKMIDYDNTNRLKIDDFIKIISESKISLSISDIQLLFHSYELYNNGIFYYEEMFKDLKAIYWNSKREKMISDVYLSLTRNNRVICIGELKSLFDPQNHILINEVGAQALVDDFNFFVEHFASIKRMKPNYVLTKTDFEEFMMYYSFGFDSDDELYNIATQCLIQPDNKQLYPREMMDKPMEYWQKDEEETKIVNRNRTPNQPNSKWNNNRQTNANIGNHTKTPITQKGKQQLNNKNNIQRKDQPDEIIVKFRRNLKQFGKKSFFNLTKHFKYYDNGTTMISKYDFAKVIKDFKLNLSVTEIEKLFVLHCTDLKQISLNYEEFIRAIITQFTNDKRITVIHETYNKLEDYANGIGESVNVDLMKAIYSGRDNIFCLEEPAAVSEFIGDIDNFHYDIKGNKGIMISREEYVEFYQMISMLIDEDEDFTQMMNNEWRKVYSTCSNSKNTPSQLHQREYKTQNKKSDDRLYDNNDHSNQSTYSQSKNNNFKDFKMKYNDNVIKNEMKEKQRPRTPLNEPNTNLIKDSVSPYTKTKQLLRPQTPTRQNPLHILTLKLRNRGIRGLMNLHKQFLFSSNNLGMISLNDFIRVLKLQRLDLLKEEYEKLFQRHSQDDNPSFLNFPIFIRAFKSVLNEHRLFVVEKAFASLDLEQNESLFIEDIKLKYDSMHHPDVTKRIRSEDEVITEFLDCFDLNYNFLTTAENPETSNMVSFEEFANFYEYVSFLYDNDQEFIEMIEATWRL